MLRAAVAMARTEAPSFAFAAFGHAMAVSLPYPSQDCQEKRPETTGQGNLTILTW